MKRWNIRVRLTLLFAAIQVVFLAALTLSVHWMFGRELVREVDQGLRDKAQALTAAYEMSDGAVEVEMDEHLRDTLWADSLAQVLRPDGKILFQNQFGTKPPLPGPPVGGASEASAYYAAHLPDRGELRCVWRTDQRYGSPVIIAIGAPLTQLRHQQAELLRIMLLASGGMVLTSVVVGWLVIGRLLRPLAAMASKTRQITADHLHDRLAVAHPHDEIGQLATTLNDMMERLHDSFNQMRRFTSDASHELRTPLTCMRSELEVALTQSRSPDEYRELLGSVLEEIQRLTRLSDALLTLARIDSGRLLPHSEVIDLNELLAEAVDRIRVQAEAKRVNLYLDAAKTPCRVKGDGRLIEQTVLNLIDNAIKYGGAEVHVQVSADGDGAVVTVRDSGPGIPAEHLEHLFERFYRVDRSRSRELGGAGLGLALAKQYVELHGGSISVISAAGIGTTFTVRFPAQANSS
ncbi:MAG: heavy metal sensor histidine kinase [Planctomycetota bacterium]